MQSTMERLKPEAAYFTAVEGDRGGFIVFDLKDPSDIPSICEPFFIELGAKCHLAPAMSVDDVQAGIAKAFPGYLEALPVETKRRERRALTKRCAGTFERFTIFAPPATDEEIRASAVQFVRKLSGFARPSKTNEAAFNQAVERVTAATQELLTALVTQAAPRDRDEEAAKAKARSRVRFARN